ncbi:hypothetical protein Sjap_017676 [Stephania japonica]|uniref:uroporphyrinogen-III C-methyltransferase n=1 Tax=Stephania japonica TaxID=461633 RepID=A0AAP0NM94_9MAGN
MGDLILPYVHGSSRGLGDLVPLCIHDFPRGLGDLVPSCCHCFPRGVRWTWFHHIPMAPQEAQNHVRYLVPPCCHGSPSGPYTKSTKINEAPHLPRLGTLSSIDSCTIGARCEPSSESNITAKTSRVPWQRHQNPSVGPPARLVARSRRRVEWKTDERDEVRMKMSGGVRSMFNGPDDIAARLDAQKKCPLVLHHHMGGGGGDGEVRGPGNVFLVGTGPGDPELLTLKALRVIESADLLLYDRLVSNDVLSLVGDDARLLYVGKTAGYHSRTQEEIHELLLSFAEVGANVVRLKGGDPLVFGRGGEEMDFLQQQGIQVKVIPGITAASGIAAELGIPLTHRGIANSVRFLTGHSRKGGTDPLFVAEHAADPDSTLVVYMGLSTLPSLAQKLMQHGLSPNTPAAAIERGTTPQQRMVFAELKDLVDEVASLEMVSPTLIVIGKVVALSPFWPHSSNEVNQLMESELTC